MRRLTGQLQTLVLGVARRLRARLQPATQLKSLVDGAFQSQAIYVAARLGVADQLAGGPLDVAALAGRVGADADALHRLLRALASLGIFEEVAPGRFALTPLAEPLREGVPGSLRAWTLLIGDLAWRPWGELLSSVRTGEASFPAVYGMSRYAYLDAHPEQSAVFDAAMSDIASRAADAIVGAYDFRPLRTVVDVGGGSGALLAAILRASPAATGILLERPAVAEAARGFLEGAGLGARSRCQAGDFLAEVPAGADAYIMKSILHNLDDTRALAVLGACRRALPPEGKVLVIGAVLRPGNQPDFVKLLDLHMLVMHGGRERSEAELAALFRAAGLRSSRTIALPGMSISEAVSA